MQRDRVSNRYPWTWEPIAAAVIGYLLASWLLLHLSRAIANVFAGGGWQLTERGHWFGSTVAIIKGDAGAGLDPSTPADTIASPTGLYIWLMLGQIWLLALAMYALVTWTRRYGSGRMHGFATPAETETLLGTARLRKNASIIRPDLYGKKADR